jgi:cyanate lyase
MLQSQASQSTRQRLTETAVASKAAKGLSWRAIAEGTGLNVVFVTAAVLGQHPLPREAAELVGRRLDLDKDAVRLLQCVPMRGSFANGVPVDPTIYRFYEIVQVYGSTLKALVHEEFGDGIMSGVNFKVTFDKVEDPEGGHRAVITPDGKYLPTKPY